MAASGNLQPSANAYIPFRDRPDFPGYEKFSRDILVQDFTSTLYNFEREQELISNNNRSPIEQKELDEILEIRKKNGDYNTSKMEIASAVGEIEKIQNEMADTIIQMDEKLKLMDEEGADQTKLLQELDELEKLHEGFEEELEHLDVRREAFENERDRLDAERTARIDKRVELAKTFIESFPFPSSDYKYTPQLIEGQPTGDPKELTGSELKEFQFLYQIQVTELAAKNTRFAELAGKSAGQLTTDEKNELIAYQPELLVKTERAKRAFEFTCEGNHRVNWPIGSEKQYFNAVQLLAGIDLSKKVDVVTFEQGALLQQKQTEPMPGQVVRVGNFFVNAEAPKTTASQVGIAAISEASVKQALVGKSSIKTDFSFLVKKAVKGLRSTPRIIGDTWSMPGRVVKTKGGGEQIYAPVPLNEKNEVFQRLYGLESIDHKIKRIEAKIAAGQGDVKSLEAEKAQMLEERKIAKEKIERNVIESMSDKSKKATLKLEGREGDLTKRILPVEGVKTKLKRLESELKPDKSEYKKYVTALKESEAAVKKSEEKVKQIETKLVGTPSEGKSSVERELKESKQELENNKQNLKNLKEHELFPLRQLKRQESRLRLTEGGARLAMDKLKLGDKFKEEKKAATPIAEQPKKQASPVVSAVEEKTKPLTTIEKLSERNKVLVNLIKEKQTSNQQSAPEAKPTLTQFKEELEKNITSMEVARKEEKMQSSPRYNLRLLALDNKDKINPHILQEAREHNSPILIRRRDEIAIRDARSSTSKKQVLGNEVSFGFVGWEAKYSVYGKKADGTWGETEIKPGSITEKTYLDKLNVEDIDKRGFLHWTKANANRVRVLPNASSDIVLAQMIEKGHATPVSREEELIKQSKIAANTVFPGMYSDPAKIADVRTPPKFERRDTYNPMHPAGQPTPPPLSHAASVRKLFSFGRKQSEAVIKNTSEAPSPKNRSSIVTSERIGVKDPLKSVMSEVAIKTLDNQQAEAREKKDPQIPTSVRNKR